MMITQLNVAMQGQKEIQQNMFLMSLAEQRSQRDDNIV